MATRYTFFCWALTLSGLLLAQLAQTQEPIPPKTAHDTPQFERFEGTYKMVGENARFIRISALPKNLSMKQLWNDSQYLFVPETELSFFSKEDSGQHLHFKKDQAGNIYAASFRGYGFMKIQKPVTDSAGMLSCTGRYQSESDADNLITIRIIDHHLVVRQEWDGAEVRLDGLSTDYFYNSTASYSMQVVRYPFGKVKQVVILGINAFDRVGD